MHSKYNTMGILKEFGKVWYAKEGMANVLSVYKLSRDHQITMDTAIDNAFHIHVNEKDTCRFGFDNKLGIYYCNINTNLETSSSICLPLVSEQKKKYLSLDNQRAGVARLIQQAMGFISTKDLLKAIDNNIIKNCATIR